jgi:hypothetical protein
MIHRAAMQSVEIRNALGIETDNLGINNQRLTEPSRIQSPATAR